MLTAMDADTARNIHIHTDLDAATIPHQDTDAHTDSNTHRG